MGIRRIFGWRIGVRHVLRRYLVANRRSPGVGLVFGGESVFATCGAGFYVANRCSPGVEVVFVWRIGGGCAWGGGGLNTNERLFVKEKEIFL